MIIPISKTEYLQARETFTETNTYKDRSNNNWVIGIDGIALFVSYQDTDLLIKPCEHRFMTTEYTEFEHKVFMKTEPCTGYYLINMGMDINQRFKTFLACRS